MCFDMSLRTFNSPNLQVYFIRSIKDIVNNIDSKCGEVSNRKITISKSQFQCVSVGVASRREALPYLYGEASYAKRL